MRTLTKIIASLVLVALCAEASDARLFDRLRARRQTRQAAASQQFAAFAPMSTGAGSCRCEGCPGNTNATNAPLAAPIWQTMPATSSGCVTINGQLVCPVRR